jgi:uncharacterized membrane protein YhfC
MALLGALERALAICLHLGLAALVWKAVVRRAPAWLVLAIAWHTAANAGALIVFNAWGAWAAEGYVAVMAAISLMIVFVVRRDEPARDPIPAQTISPLRTPPGSISPLEDAKSSQIEDSRYLD